MKLIESDPWLQPYAPAIEGRAKDADRKEQDLTQHCHSLQDFANAYKYFGLHKDPDGWVFREWAPKASQIWLIGDFNNWEKSDAFELQKHPSGVWEGHFPKDAIHNEQLYKMLVQWPGGIGERIPAYATRVIQDPETHIFSAQVWEKEPYKWKVKDFTPDTRPLLIYETHVGMAQEREGVGSYVEFRDKILPRIAASGYNAIQVMAIQEHPYYGSFGYHVSSFYAPSSRFGTPEELKSMIDRAHELGIAVIMDIVHSHAVKNEAEGLGRLDGTRDQYFYPGEKGEHPAWDSLCFDYGKDEVLHFLLSNCKYWLEEFNMDGFRFDGVTSMLYYNHGLGQDFASYDDYYNGNQDTNAITYLTLANTLIHELKPSAITIAEDMSGLPGIATPRKDGGIGFDYRLSMGVPDYWIKMLKERKDQDWHPSSIFYELTNRRKDEKTVSYVESHDQALVGDKTVIFRLIDQDMYWHMSRDDQNLTVARGIALHKLIRLVTASTINGGYLNFMGNEFGHPEWIDFPREGNGWSYKYARRQWSLVDSPDLKYQWLDRFDKDMVHLIAGIFDFQALEIDKLWEKDSDQVLAFMRGDMVFVFNFNPEKAYSDYGVLAPGGVYRTVLSTDNPKYGGYGNIDESVEHFTKPDPLWAPAKREWLKLYLPPRTALVLKKNK